MPNSRRFIIASCRLMYFCRLSPDEFRHVCEALPAVGKEAETRSRAIARRQGTAGNADEENEKRLKTAPPPREVAALVNVEIDNAA